MSRAAVLDTEEEQLYDELRRMLEEVEETDQRKRELNRMIRQLKFTKWWKERLVRSDASSQNIKPARLWIMLATGALTPVVVFTIFIWVSLWVE
ncbi:hypothetical protein MHB84_08085 [Paenibacillus sp. FSL F4-0087]|uniref:hypothetical protein n=1 Tax=unclassified Paenibacillus TaxID=185978 RepID=UPI00089208D4|nr:hypothetical protein [Paenibacillus sp. OK060]OME80438.1 hypothetical protein BK122_18745 [Paenibacillus pabuli]SDL16491.1 hypothetical protein SAMN05428961_104127 [Paenibacillus sp. OK060]